MIEDLMIEDLMIEDLMIEDLVIKDRSYSCRSCIYRLPGIARDSPDSGVNRDVLALFTTFETPASRFAPLPGLSRITMARLALSLALSRSLSFPTSPAKTDVANIVISTQRNSSILSKT